jgi:hypothetical protein
MSQFQARIIAVATNGPYAFSLFKDGVGLVDRNGQTTIGNALDAVKADIAANLAGQTVTIVNMTVNST